MCALQRLCKHSHLSSIIWVINRRNHHCTPSYKNWTDSHILIKYN